MSPTEIFLTCQNEIVLQFISFKNVLYFKELYNIQLE